MSDTIEASNNEKEFIKESIKEKSIRGFLLLCASVSILFIFFIILFLFLEGGEFFANVSIWDFLLGTKWLPTYEDAPLYGAFPIIVGTFLVSFGAMIIAVPLGVCTAIFISELAPPKLSKLMKGAVEILSGVPSVIFGFFGLIVLNVWLMDTFGLTTGNTWFSGSLILALMALPTIVSVSEDALNAVPNDYREASLAMGATKWQTIKNTVLPAAISGITAAIILGMGRAIGETMAVMMVTGNSGVFPEPLTNMFTPIQTITGTIGIELREATGVHMQALFALAIVLFFITLTINLAANLILAKLNQRFTGKQKERRIKLLLPKVVKDHKKQIQE